MVPPVKLIRKTEQKSRKAFLWQCKCGLCGNYFLALPCEVRRGNTKSCGCLRNIGIPCPTQIDYSNTTIGYLAIESQAGRDDEGRILWNCICTFRNCGKRVVLSSQQIQRNGSCNCWGISRRRKAVFISRMLESAKRFKSGEDSFPTT